MVTPLVSESAITASLFFAIGYGRTPSSQGPALPEELRETVAARLGEQGSGDSLAQALDAVRAGREAVQNDATLTISVQRYEQHRSQFLAEHATTGGKGKNVWPVGSTTILKRAGGSWNSALASAGLAVSSRERAAGFGRARFTTEQFQAAIRDFALAAAREGSSTSYRNYTEWRKQSQEHGRMDLPSGPSIRNSYGSWSAALQSVSDQSSTVRSSTGGEEPGRESGG
ncbi:hypothetical protein [Nesterenkonia lutea]|uniref:Uncharacterized protein n=1 Tax=Nesterenkonia lutea TaxID=272919 RepID=A0ABR9JC85_9MICC|nr:hypothetical protein [Nesterenkonia lutea]MBE1523544.1 hypothetical protein [Nesterenkonia lutea]